MNIWTNKLIIFLKIIIVIILRNFKLIKSKLHKQQDYLLLYYEILLNLWMLLPRQLLLRQLFSKHLLSKNSCSSATVPPNNICFRTTLVLATFSFLQPLVRITNNQKPIRKLQKLHEDLAIVLTFIWVSAFTVNISPTMLREQVSSGNYCLGSNIHVTNFIRLGNIEERNRHLLN